MSDESYGSVVSDYCGTELYVASKITLAVQARRFFKHFSGPIESRDETRSLLLARVLSDATQSSGRLNLKI